MQTLIEFQNTLVPFAVIAAPIALGSLVGVLWSLRSDRPQQFDRKEPTFSGISFPTPKYTKEPTIAQV